LKTDGRLSFPSHKQQVFLRGLYRTFRGRANRHNSRLWPYVSLGRDESSAITRLSVCRYNVPLVSVQEAFANTSHETHIILSGPSVAEIDYAQLPTLQTMGVNGSILLQDKVDITFPFYCLIDRTF